MKREKNNVIRTYRKLRDKVKVTSRKSMKILILQ